MAVSAMSVGRDYSIVFYDRNTGDTVELGDVQSVRITHRKSDIESQPYNDEPRFGFIPGGYDISFDIVRVNAQLENFHLGLVDDFYAGRHVRDGFLNETVRNPNGSVERYQYTRFVFFISDPADISREKNVTMRAEGRASRKRRIA